MDSKIGFVPNLEIKEDKKKETVKEKIFSNPYEQYIKTWEPGDPLPLIPPGKVLHICKFHPNLLATGGETYETQEKYKNAVKFKSGQPSDIEYKILGRKLKDSVESLLSRAVRGAGRGLWVDDKNKLRCPPGTPNANQFTDMAGSNCLIPSPARAAQSGARAIRGAVTGVAQRAADVGQRIEQSFDAARATQEQIVELGFSRAQQMMSVGGRLSPGRGDMAAISGAMLGRPRLGPLQPRQTGRPRTPRRAGFRNAPEIDEDVALKPWFLGMKEKVQRGQRATELARSLNDRILDPNRNPTPGNPGGLKMPDGTPIGDIRDKQNFVRVMSMLFPSVAPTREQVENEWGRVFDNSIPRNLTKINKIRARENLVTFWQGMIAETINNPQAGKLITRVNSDPNLNAAFSIDMDHFAPLPSTTQAGTRAATKRQAAEQGGVHVSMNINPLMFFQNSMNMTMFDTNGRSNGVRDTMQGDMHYMATHEFGHLVHFQQVFNQLGFDMQNMSRYPDTDALVGGPNRGPSWEPQSQSNAWRIDFRQARNPTGNKSIQLLIDSATNLSSRSYYGSRGGTRQELERDLDNFHNALVEAVNNNITDTHEERELMRQFAGGTYATQNNLETRAEYYAARRLFADPATAPLGVQQPNPLDKFAQAKAAEQNPQYTPSDVIRILNGVGVSTFGVMPNRWNISGRMSVNQNRPTLKAQAVRRAVEKNYGPIRPKISGAMKGSQPFANTMSSRVWKREDLEDLTNWPRKKPNTDFYVPTPPGFENLDPGFYFPTPPGFEDVDPGFYLPTPPGFENVERMKPNTISGRMSSRSAGVVAGVRNRFDGSKSSDVEMKVYEMDGERIVFDNPDAVSINDPSIKIISKNPYEITGKANTSKQGREYSEKWLNAQLGRGEIESNDVDALLYLASRGDAKAAKELDELAEKGKKQVSEAEEKLYKPFEFSPEQQNVLTRAGLNNLSIDDLYVVHETNYEPQVDENGDISIAPRSNFEETAKSGKKVRVPRHTIHFALNHLVGGHMFRQRSENDTTILIAPLSQVLKDNPDSLDNLYAIDTILTPKPGEGIKMKSGTFRRIKGTSNKDATEEAVRQQLVEMGATKIFTAESAESSNEAQDLAIRKIANQLKTSSGLHANIPSGQLERYLIRQAGSGDNAKVSGLSPDLVAGMSKNYRQRLGDSNFWSDAETLRSRISGRMSSGPTPQSRKSRIKKNKDGVPQHPRKPTYGPMLGNFEQVFENVSSWEEFKQKYNNQEIVFLDYETTGIVFDKYGRVLDNGTPTQIGAVKVRGGEIVDRFNIFVNPGQPLGEWSRKNLKDADGNPLTDEYLADKTPVDEAHRLLASFAGPNALMGVQNAGYDKDVLDDVLKKSGIDWAPSGWIDLKDMAGMTLPRWSQENQDGPSRIDGEGNRVPSNSLADITKYLGVNLGKDHHNADKDAEATAESMKKLIDGAIEKNWSTDVLSPEKRRSFVKKTEDAYELDIKEFDTELANYLVNRISGEMSSSPKNNTIKLNLMNASNGSQVGGRQTRSYYQNLKNSLRWNGAPEPETLEQSEPKRILNRKKNIADIKQFLANDENSQFTDGQRATLTENLNGLNPEFFEYLRNSSESDLLADLRQAAIEFHAGVDRRPRINIEPRELENIINNGLNAKSSSTSSAGLQELKKLYEANIGIPPSMDENIRPVVGYVVHSNTVFAETEEAFERFSKNNLSQKDRYNFELFGNFASNKRRGFNSIFGDAEIILKPEVGGRTSYGNGDWLENHVYPVEIDSSDSDVIGRALIDGVARFDDRQMNSIELLYGKFQNNYDAYRKDNGKTRPEFRSTWANRDAFILGGFEPNEIEEIRIPYKEIQADKPLIKSIIDGIVQEPRFVDGEPLDRRSFSEASEQRFKNVDSDSYVPNFPSVETSYELKNSRKAEKISYNRVTGELEITYKNGTKGKFSIDKYWDWEQFQTDLNKTTTSKAADNLIKKLETGKIGKKINNLPNPVSNEYSSIASFSPQTTFVPTSDSQKNTLNNVEKTIIQDLLYGASPSEAIDKRIAVRINDLSRYESIQKDYKSLLKVLTANKLRDAANAQEIEFSVTNEFGLNVFSGISFDKDASKKSKAEEVLKNRIEKQIKNLIKELRRAQKEISEK